MRVFNIDISRKGISPVVQVTEHDAMSRFFTLVLRNGSADYEEPEGATYSVWYRTKDSHGWYDTITEPDNGTHPAVVADGNEYTIEIAEQATTSCGELALMINGDDGYQLTVSGIITRSDDIPGYDGEEVENYYNVYITEMRENAARAENAAATAIEYGASVEVDETAQQLIITHTDNTEDVQTWVTEAEAWAVGQRDGVDVPSTDETYHNNAEYYAEQAAQSAASLTVDTELSSTSTNPVQNKVIDATVTELKNETTELKSDFHSVMGVSDLCPSVHRGSVNINTGAITPSESTLNRLYSDYIPLDSYDTAIVSNDLNAYVIYYNSDKSFASNSGGFLKNELPLNTSYAYAVLFLANSDNTDFDTVPTNAFYATNKGKTALRKNSFEKIAKSVGLEKTLYSHLTGTTRFTHTSRWFFPEPLPANSYVDRVKSVGTSGTGTLHLELWKKDNKYLKRIKEYTFEVAATSANQDNSLLVDYASDTETYISIYGSWGAIVCGDSGNEEGMLVLLDDTASTTFEYANLSPSAGYLASFEIKYFSMNAQRQYRIGEYDNVAEVLTEAMKYPNSIVYIEPYEHNCIAEWEAFFGSDYFSSMSSGRGLELYNNVHIIGESGCVLKCHYAGDNDYVMANFSVFNNDGNGTGYTIENVIFDCKKIRYIIHDERGSTVIPYKVAYKRCDFSQDQTGSTWDRSRACIGGGLGKHGDVTVEDCIFRTVTSSVNKDSLAYHNSEASNAQSSLVIKNCYCAGDSTLQLASYGSSTLKTKVLVANCSFGSAIEELDWTGGTPNFEIYYINNEIRTS